MHENEEIARKFSFISGAGKASGQIRNYPWEETILGLPENWPQALKTALGMLLQIDSPMYLVWGDERIQFYNDAFLDLLPDDRIKIGKSISNIENPYIQAAFQGKAVSGEPDLSSMNSVFSFSPVYAENNLVGGVLIAPKRPKEWENKSVFYELITQSPFGIAVLKGEDFVIDLANDEYLALVGRKKEDFIGKPLMTTLPELLAQGLNALLTEVMKSGIPYIGNEFEVDIVKNGNMHKGYFNFVCSPFHENNRIVGVMVVATEVTDLVTSLQTFKENEKKLLDMIMQSPIPVTIFRGKDYVIEMANTAMFEEVWRKNPEEVIGYKLLDVFPELKGQKYPQLLDRVMETGIPHSENEAAAIVNGNDGKRVFYLDYEYAPLFDSKNRVSGILITVNDVTEKVQIREKIQESETRQKIAIESAEIGTFDWNMTDSEFIFSERLAQIFGYENSDGLNHNSFSSLIHPEDAAMRTRAHKESFLTGKLFYEARFIKPDRSLCWLRLNGKVFFDEKGSPSRMYGTVLDITDQKTTTYALENEVNERTRELQAKNEQLKRSEERYHRMTEEVQDYAIILLSIDGTILNWNKGAQKIKGYTEQEITGKKFNIFYLQEDVQNHLPEKIIEEARTFGRAAHEGWRIRKDSSIFWGSIVITALHDNDGNIIGFSKVTRDLTERKISEDKMKQYTTELEFQNKELEQFAYIASHDLQEPLRKIQTFSSMLQNNLDNRESAELFLHKIKSSAHRMTELIKAVLNYSRLSKTVIDKEPVDLNVLIESIKVDFELLIAEKNANIIYSELPSIMGISLQLTQLFSNLIGNSLKFADKTPEIRISSRLITDREILKYPNLQSDLKYVELAFSDNGIGFEKQYSGQIFNMFQRLHDKQTYSGTGIGLALCKRIVENHHGYITAASELGKGATFYIYLPVQM